VKNSKILKRGRKKEGNGLLGTFYNENPGGKEKKTFLRNNLDLRREKFAKKLRKATPQPEGGGMGNDHS